MRSLRRALLTVPPGTAPEVHLASGYCPSEGEVVLPAGTVLIGTDPSQVSSVNTGGRCGAAGEPEPALLGDRGVVEIDRCVLQSGLVATDTRLDLRRSVLPSEGAAIQAWYGDAGAAKDAFRMEDCQSWYGDLRITCDGVVCGPVTIERSSFVQIRAGGWLEAVNGGRMLVKLRDTAWAQDIFVRGDVRFIGQ